MAGIQDKEEDVGALTGQVAGAAVFGREETHKPAEDILRRLISIKGDQANINRNQLVELEVLLKVINWKALSDDDQERLYGFFNRHFQV